MSGSELNAGDRVDGSSTIQSGAWVWSLRVLAATALGLTVYLTWAALTASPVVGCGGHELFDCEHVLTSKWSKVGVIPVGVPAVLLYSCVLSALVFCRHPGVAQIRRISWICVTTCAVAAGLSALWFTGLQIFAVQQLCPWCLATHACGLAICGILLWKRPVGMRMTGRLAGIGSVSVGLLITLQILTPAAPTFEVLRFDDSSGDPAEISDNRIPEVDVSEEFFAAPETPTTSDSDVFEAPVFEPPTDVPAHAAPVESVTDAETDDNSAGGDATGTAAASLLMLFPPQITLLMNVLSVQVDGEEDSSAAGDSDEETPSEPAAAEPRKPKRRLIGVNGNKFRLDIRQWPLLGVPEAKYVFVEMFDYTCSHCRNTHRAIRGAFDRYGDDLAIIALPVPLDRKCNRHASGSGGTHRDSCEISRIAVAVWRIDAEKFHQLHDWLFETSRTAAATKRHAEQLVGRDRLAQELQYPTAGEYIARHVQLYGRVGAGSVPKLMFPRSSMVGEVSSTETLCNAIERELVNPRP